jgi:adenylosuccinate lyase
MASHMIDYEIYRDAWGTAEMREIWSERAMLQRWLDIEVALAEVQAELKVIPPEAAREIKAKAKVEDVDWETIKKEYARTGHSIVPLLREVQRLCRNNLGEYIHLGATTQDITDTGMMLGLRQAHRVLVRDLEAIEASLMKLAQEHKNTPMAGRTHGQQALPITFGIKAAIWLREVSRHLERLAQCEKRIFVGNLSGGVGSYASFGGLGLETERRVMEKIGLGQSDSPWHVARDRFAEYCLILAMVATTLGKIGNEVYELQKMEIGELQEPFQPGQVGSSTMPHKRNPEIAEALHGLSKIVRHLAGLALETMFAEHERDGAAWKPEWVAVPEICIYTHAILDKGKYILAHLGVNRERMGKNLNLLGGLILSENVMLALGEKLGKQSAHTLVYHIAGRVYDEGLTFKEALMQDREVRQKFSEEEIDRMLDPARYVGESEAIVARAVARTQEEYSKRPWRS